MFTGVNANNFNDNANNARQLPAPTFFFFLFCSHTCFTAIDPFTFSSVVPSLYPTLSCSFFLISCACASIIEHKSVCHEQALLFSWPCTCLASASSTDSNCSFLFFLSVHLPSNQAVAVSLSIPFAATPCLGDSFFQPDAIKKR